MQYESFLPDESATIDLGKQLAHLMVPGLIIFLIGHLGAGKTTLVRALIQSLGYQGRIKSPTYTLMELYKLPDLCLYHFDFYRFNDPSEWIDAGFKECFDNQNICLIEWPEKATGLLPTADLEIRLSLKDNGRQVIISAPTNTGRNCLKKLQPS